MTSVIACKGASDEWQASTSVATGTRFNTADLYDGRCDRCGVCLGLPDAPGIELTGHCVLRRCDEATQSQLGLMQRLGQ
jgi:hypothetical protein